MRTTGVHRSTHALVRAAVTAALVGALAGLGAVSGFAGTDAATGTPAPAGFRLADDSAGCALYASGQLACRARGEAATVVLGPDGAAERTDDAVRWSKTTSVLLPAESWWHGAFSCRVRAERLVCENRSGGSISVTPRPGRS